ncbi:putative bifunctional diguanylate cyclase/phosphodiesterase [Vibrio viridaestus]|uniref:Bifunctional diguanylate cyclase/phosphodiesterase n=1 Tax=Vibrio viridaestus TaxID=2487322 RepID=A0A3N9U590_9VIBR|nr:bifunctional diguanylate cyclase/phosphodiesterase [Vibrio viridaestus]RQW63206.1 bifunctional diguanylate cyclase/phosphodiesterase [Vibrio viridaestus]
MLSRKLFGLVSLLTLVLIFCLWTVYKLEGSYNLLTKHTQLSAWALAKMGLETEDLVRAIEKNQFGEAGAQQDLQLKYDILWNRYSTFLTSKETAQMRAKFNAKEEVTTAFNKLKLYETAVITNDLRAQARMLDDFNQVEKDIRDLIIISFTSEQSVQQRELLSRNKNETSLYILVMLLVFIVLSYMVYKDAKAQQFLAWKDPLTKLGNRNDLMRLLKEESSNSNFHLLLFDIHGFKGLNDSIGYEYGDQLLVSVAKQLMAISEQYEIHCFRIGADEFAITSLNPDLEVKSFAKRLWNKVDACLKELDPAKRMTLSMGVVASSALLSNSQHIRRDKLILNHAELALNRAQKALNGPIVYFDQDIEQETRKRKRLTDDLSLLLLEGNTQTQLYLCYQPIVDINQREKIGCEALLRWSHPDFGMINPEYVISIAEEAGLGQKLGLWAIRCVRDVLLDKLKPYSERVEISVNLSDSLFNTDLSSTVLDIFGRDNEHLLKSVIFEITETMTLDDLPLSQAVIQDLKSIGIRTALDDFGTGWSSMYNLNHLSFDKVKIDRSFIVNIHELDKQSLFTSSIVSLSHGLGIRVVAEGVEKVEELDKLKELGIDEFQGFYFSKPAKIDKFITYCQQYLITV